MVLTLTTGVKCPEDMRWVEAVFAAVSDTLSCGFPEMLEGQGGFEE